MIRLHGIAAAPGVVVARPQRLEHGEPGANGPALDLDAAVAQAVAELETVAERMAATGRGAEAAIFEAQALLAADEELLAPARSAIADGAAVDAAIVAAGELVAVALESLDDEILAGRGADARDVAQRIARASRGEPAPRLTERVVVVARDLAPSVTADLDRDLLAGIALEAGSRTSHAAILARALEIPAVLGVPGLLAALPGVREMVVDGGTGEIVLDPDDAERHRASDAAVRHRAAASADEALREQPLRTSDGHTVMLGANIGGPDDAARAIAAGAQAVGLLRTEFTFVDRGVEPDEATQVAAYASVLRQFGSRPVVMRLIDVGGDKPLAYLPLAPESNPFLGVRAIRLARRSPDLLTTQLRAMLRAALATGVSAPRIMAPMVADLADLRMVRHLLEEAMAVVDAPLDPQLGIMVEVPSAVLVADRLAAEAAFFSVGTNDLTQYLLAADRTNPDLAASQDPLHPAVLRAIAQLTTAARRAAVPVAVCGEMAADPAGAVLLVGLGIDELSMDPSAFGAVKRALGGVTLDRTRELAALALDLDDAVAVRQLVEAG
ncbi:MAG: phosphoenolpyruvate--protein phosphotransferase [Chloroflexota bacterium]